MKKRSRIITMVLSAAIALNISGVALGANVTAENTTAEEQQTEQVELSSVIMYCSAYYDVNKSLISVKQFAKERAVDEVKALTEANRPQNAEFAKIYIWKTDSQMADVTSVTFDTENAVVLGDEQLNEYVPLLEGKRVALFSNHTGIMGDKTSEIGELSANDDASLIHFGVDVNGNEITYGEHILDVLIDNNVNVTAIFSPEHGFRGTADAGAAVDDSVDEKTGVPILSLYGSANTHSPSAEDMAKFDTLVVDMQDVGLRYYTYYISMYYLMNACALAGKNVVILDRPNPNGFYVDGPILKDEYKSVVGQLPIPIVYGMTWGELAQMINGEGWLDAGKYACDLTVIPCRNYTHQTKTSLIRNPSPNIKDMRAVYLYASTCFFENTAVSVGRGTQFPFEAYGSPYLNGVAGFDFSFTPVSMSGAAEPPFKNETCYGVDLRNVPISQIWENQINLEYLCGAYEAVKASAPKVAFWGTPDKEGRYWIDMLTGTDEVRKQIEAGMSAEEIKLGWQDEIAAFKEQRRPYLLYAE